MHLLVSRYILAKIAINREEIKFRDIGKYDFRKATFVNYENKYRALLLICYLMLYIKYNIIFFKYTYIHDESTDLFCFQLLKSRRSNKSKLKDSLLKVTSFFIVETKTVSDYLRVSSFRFLLMKIFLPNVFAIVFV